MTHHPSSHKLHAACQQAFDALLTPAHFAPTLWTIPYLIPYYTSSHLIFTRLFPRYKNGAILLDKLIRDIVIETKTIDIEAIIPLLKAQITRTKPYIRQLLVGWIMVLKAVPNIHLLDFLPDFLGGLFDMLGDSAQEIREAASNALSSFLHDIRCNSALKPDSCPVHIPSHSHTPALTPILTHATFNALHRDADIVEFGPMIKILVLECSSANPANRLTALAWLMEFMKIAGVQLLPFYAELLKCITQCISDKEVDVRGLSSEANEVLRMLVRKTTDNFPLRPLLGTLTAEMLSEHVSTRIASLDWMSMLYEKCGEDMNTCIDEVQCSQTRTPL